MRTIVTALCILPLLLTSFACSDPEKPEVKARTLQPYPVHTLPLGVTLDSLQKILHGHSALFSPLVEKRMYRIIPLNAYGNVGYGAVELFPDGKSRTYYWYTNLAVLTEQERRYYTQDRPAVNLAPVLDTLKRVLGEPQIFTPYPKEEWYTWRHDSTQINLTVQNDQITLTKTTPSPIALESDTTLEPVASATPKASTKKKVITKKATVKKSPAKKAPVKKRTAARRKN